MSYKTYQEAIPKVVNNKLKPPKQKHIRKVILETFNDLSYQNYKIYFDKLLINDKFVYQWKLLILWHAVMRDGKNDIIMWDYYHTKLGAILPATVYETAQKEVFLFYIVYLKYKCKFHSKFIYVLGNISRFANDNPYPFKDVEQGYNYLGATCNYFNLNVYFLEKQLDRLSHGMNHSETTEGQLLLLPLYYTLLDTNALYEMLTNILKISLPKMSNTLKLQEILDDFNNSFYKYKNFISKVNTITFIRSLMAFPDLPDRSPLEILQNLLNAKIEKLATPTPTPVDNSAIELEVSTLKREYELQIARLQEKTAVDTRSMVTNHYETIIFELQTTIRELEASKDSLKQKFKNKYESDVQLLNEQCQSLLKEKEILQSELDQIKKQTDKCQEDEKFEKLKSLYIDLRRKYEELYDKYTTDKKKVETLSKENEELKSRTVLLNEQQNVNEINSSLKLKQQEEEFILRGTKAKEDIVKLTEKNEELEHQISTIKMIQTEQISQLSEKIAELEIKEQQVESILNNNQDLFDFLINKYKKSCDEILQNSTLESTKVAVNASITNFKTKLNDHMKTANPSDKNTFNLQLIDLAIENLNMLQSIKGLANSINDEDEKQKILNILSSFMKNFNTFLNNANDPSVIYVAEIQDLDYKLKGLQGNIDSIREVIIEVIPEIMPENELLQAERKIKIAAEMLAAVLQQVRKDTSGEDLLVNEKIIDGCNDLLMLAKELVKDSRILQEEIVKDQSGEVNVKEFYKKNSKWSEGLTSASKLIGNSCYFLVQTADRVVNSTGSLEELIVAAGDVSASTVELVTASRTKADPESNNLENVIKSSKKVKLSSEKIVNSAKDAVDTRKNDEDNIDISRLSTTQAKRVEMACQIKVLEFENKLEKERRKLLSIRKKNYHD